MSCYSTVQFNACIKLLAIWKNWSPISNYERSNVIEKKYKVPVPGDLIWPYGVHFLRNLHINRACSPRARLEDRPQT